MVQGVPVCFDAKECHSDAFPLANIHKHQIRFMQDFESQGGVAFLILYFAGRDAFYYLRFEDMMRFWDRGASGGKSISVLRSWIRSGSLGREETGSFFLI